MSTCVARGYAWHKTCWTHGTPQHLPKKGMGGNNPESVVVAYLCVPLHDAIDNGWKLDGRRLSNAVESGAYVIRDRDKGEELLRL